MGKEELIKIIVENMDGKMGFGKLRRFGNFYFSGVPSKEGLQALKDAGITKIIDLNEPGEAGTPEAQWAKELGLDYVNVPVGGCHALSADKIEEVDKFLDHDEKTLLHCMSGNRVSSWFASHLFYTHDLTEDQAIEYAQETGMDNMNILNNTKAVLETLKKNLSHIVA